jgi:glycine/D-amino acid oxidase-like deaminating enzyme
VSDSLWQKESALGRASFASMEGERDVDVLVVGAGLSGLATARALRARGRRPVLVDRQGPGAGASARNGGFVLVTHVFSYPEQRRRLGPVAARALLALARENHERVRAIAGSSPEASVGYRPAGSLMLSVQGDAAEARTLSEAQALLEQDGARARFVEVPEGLAGFEHALHLPDDGEVHPGKLVAALADGLDTVVATLERIDFDAHVAYARGGGRLTYRDVVIATNAWAGDLVPELAEVVEKNRGQMLATAPLRPVLEHVCYAGWGYEYFRQRPDGRVLLGGRRAQFREAERTDVSEPSAPVQGALDGYLERHLPFTRDAPVTDRWAGIMGFTPDGLPLVGGLPGRPGAWVIAGFNGHGLGLALACAERLAARVAGERVDESDVVTALLAPGRLGGVYPRNGARGC